MSAGGAAPAKGGRVPVQWPALAGSGAVWVPVCRAFGAGAAIRVAFENGDPAVARPGGVSRQAGARQSTSSVPAKK